MEAGAGHVRDDERVAGAAEEDADECHDEAEAAEHREQHHGGLALRRPNREQVAPIDVRDERGTDQEPGDVVLFHCRTFHAARSNSTNEVKLSLVFTYHAADNEPLPGTRSASMPPIAV
jgi:hypothetical protein